MIDVHVCLKFIRSPRVPSNRIASSLASNVFTFITAISTGGDFGGSLRMWISVWFSFVGCFSELVCFWSMDDIIARDWFIGITFCSVDERA